jgi:class 3 adenylate cyclase/CHASE2 domain-containing sensor protein
LCCSGLLFSSKIVKLPRLNRAPVWIALAVIVLVCVAHAIRLDLFERVEALAYDMRVRYALRHDAPATNLFAFVYIDEQTLRTVQDGSVGYRFGLYWPRQVYGRVITELSAEKVQAVALDVIFGELRTDHPSVLMDDGGLIDSDDLFAYQLRASSNTVLALTPQVQPPELFLTNAPAWGDITTDKDPDGILRRVRAFGTYRAWHPIFRQLEADPEFGVDLGRALFASGKLILPRTGAEEIVVPLDEEGRFELADFVGENQIVGIEPRAMPYTEERVWHMGVVLAAWHLDLRLDDAEIDLPRGRIVLRGSGGTIRTLPVDREGYFMVNWALTPDDARLLRVPMHEILRRAWERNRFRGPEPFPKSEHALENKLVVVGSAAVTGNDLVDRGATPFSSDTILASKHWNVANSIILGQFVRRTPLGTELLIIAFLGFAAAFVAWNLRAVPALFVVAFIAAGYVAFCSTIFLHSRHWIPMAMPLGGLLLTNVCLLTWRVVFEQAAKRRVSGVLSTIVSPKIARELLQAEKLTLGGTRREITVLFADVRGFTELTDLTHQHAEAFVRNQRLDPAAAEAHLDEQARQTLATVNLYLGTLADTIINRDGTLDKFIGDCVMAFWGAPTATPNHAIACVRAAIEGQRAIHRVNEQRAEANERIEIENRNRIAAGVPPRPLLPILTLGTGINTGMATVGLMGSEVQAVVRQGNYTVFGREVNLASRLESLSGSSRIYISQSTFDQLKRDDPALAETCIPLPPVTVKGISGSVAIYEVPWKLEAETPVVEYQAAQQ